MQNLLKILESIDNSPYKINHVQRNPKAMSNYDIQQGNISLINDIG